MFLDNPVIAKELIQAAHRKRTYYLRAALPLIVVLLVTPSIIALLNFASTRSQGQDWRAMADIVRPVFTTTSWIELIVLSIAAYLYCGSAVQDEWTNRTMELLCATPVSRFKILYGKFFAAMSRVVMIALTLLPIMGMLFQLGRVPASMFLNSFAVILGSILFFGAVGLFQGCLRRSRGLAFSMIGILVPYFGGLIYLNIVVWPHNPILEALLPILALSQVLRGAMPVVAFAWISLSLQAFIALLALVGAPYVFARSFRLHLGGGAKVRFLPRLRRAFQGRRPKMSDKTDPLLWQEKGGPTHLLSWSVWIIYVITLIFAVVFAVKMHDWRFFGDAGFYYFMAIEGLVAMAFLSMFYGSGVFAREKQARRAHELLLIGRPPREFLWAKIRATYWALRFAYIPVAASCVVMINDIMAKSRAGNSGTCLVLEVLLLGPAVGVIIGMAFSTVARSATNAILGLLSSLAWGMLLSVVLSMTFMLSHGNESALPAAIVMGVLMTGLLVFVRKWSVWKLGLLLALEFMIFGMVMATAADQWRLREGGMTLIGSVTVIAFVWLWLKLAARFFAAGMAGNEPPRLWGTKRLK